MCVAEEGHDRRGYLPSGFPGSCRLFTILEDRDRAGTHAASTTGYGSTAGFVLGATRDRRRPDDAHDRGKPEARRIKRGDYRLPRPPSYQASPVSEEQGRTLCGVKVTADDASIIRTGFRLRYDLLGTASARVCARPPSGLHYGRYINQRRFKRVFHYLPANYLLLLGKRGARSGIIRAWYS